MDRLTWYTAGESMEELLCQAGSVGIYDGDSKNVIVRLLPPPMHNIGPVTESPYCYIRFVFRNGGEDEFYKKYDEALKRKTWQRTSSSSSSAGVCLNFDRDPCFQSRTSHPQGQVRTAGIGAIEKRLQETHARTHESISQARFGSNLNFLQAFEDMSKLMESARDMVGLSKSITEKLRQQKGEISEDETVAFKSYLLSLGVSDPVTKTTFGGGTKYFEKLAEELITILAQPLKENGGMMALPEVFCRVNRARGMELLSPEDLLNACQSLQSIPDSPIALHRFPSGVLVIHLKDAGVESTVETTTEYVTSLGHISPSELAQKLGITVILAKERLLAAEEKDCVCRDETVEGLIFYPNRFLETS